MRPIKPMKRKAQYAMEYLLFFASMSIVFTIFLVNYSDNLQQIFRDRDIAGFQDVGESIRSQLTVASTVREGYSSSYLDIPQTVGGKAYVLNNTPYVVVLAAETNDYVFPIPYTVGMLKKGANTIWNVGGVVGVGDYPPFQRPDGNVNFTQCSDGLDNDGDGDIDFPADSQCSAWQQDNETG